MKLTFKSALSHIEAAETHEIGTGPSEVRRTLCRGLPPGFL